MRGLFFMLICMLASCSPDHKGEVPNNDYESSTFKRAKEKYELRDYRSAINLYEEVLRDNPSMAKAHFELGLIYNDKIGDPISAIYHFRKFLQLKPNAERARTVEEWISRAELSIASSQPNSPMESTEQFVELQKENLALKNTNEKLQQELAWIKHQFTKKTVPLDASSLESKKILSEMKPIVTETQAMALMTNAIALRLVTNADVVLTNLSKSSEVSKTHTVQAGETLWRIAVRYYPEQVKEGAVKIMEANHLSDPSKIKSGQILTIP